MFKRRVNVKSYFRRDGTLVSTHLRGIDDAGISGSNLSAPIFSLAESGPPILQRQGTVKDAKKIAKKVQKNSSAKPRFNFLPKLWAIGAGASTLAILATPVFWFFAGASSLVSLGAGLVGLPVMGLLSLLFSKLSWQGAKKYVFAEEEAQGLRPTKKQLNELAKFYPKEQKQQTAIKKNRPKNKVKSNSFTGRLKDPALRGPNILYGIVSRARSKLDRHGFVHVEWDCAEWKHSKEEESYGGKIIFHPAGDFSSREIPFLFDMSEGNVQEANFSGTTFKKEVTAKGTNLKNSDFSGVKFDEPVSFVEADLRGTNFSNAKFEAIDLTGAKLKGSDFSNARLGKVDFRNLDMSGARLPDDLEEAEYEQINFNDAIAELGISEQRFEFLVLSGVIVARDNVTQKKVEVGHDPEKHHVAPWDLKNYFLALA